MLPLLRRVQIHVKSFARLIANVLNASACSIGLAKCPARHGKLTFPGPRRSNINKLFPLFDLHLCSTISMLLFMFHFMNCLRGAVARSPIPDPLPCGNTKVSAWAKAPAPQDVERSSVAEVSTFSGHATGTEGRRWRATSLGFFLLLLVCLYVLLNIYQSYYYYLICIYRVGRGCQGERAPPGGRVGRGCGCSLRRS